MVRAYARTEGHTVHPSTVYSLHQMQFQIHRASIRYFNENTSQMLWKRQTQQSLKHSPGSLLADVPQFAVRDISLPLLVMSLGSADTAPSIFSAASSSITTSDASAQNLPASTYSLPIASFSLYLLDSPGQEKGSLEAHELIILQTQLIVLMLADIWIFYWARCAATSDKKPLPGPVLACKESSRPCPWSTSRFKINRRTALHC